MLMMTSYSPFWETQLCLGMANQIKITPALFKVFLAKSVCNSPQLAVTLILASFNISFTYTVYFSLWLAVKHLIVSRDLIFFNVGLSASFVSAPLFAGLPPHPNKSRE
jgi:hypothetical protein